MTANNEKNANAVDEDNNEYSSNQSASETKKQNQHKMSLKVTIFPPRD